MASKIEDYALLTNMSTAALVSREGSVDWFCPPRFDSEAAFAALLGTEDHGRWLMAPASAVFPRPEAEGDPEGQATTRVAERFYGENSFVLHTVWTTETGSVRVTDFMPLGNRAEISRRVEGLTGEVTMHQELAFRFNFGRTVPWVTRYDGAPDPQTGHPDPDEGMLVAMAGPDALVYRGDPIPEAAHRCHAGQFDISAGQVRDFSLSYFASHRNPPPAVDFNETLHRTADQWSEWSDQFNDPTEPVPVSTGPVPTTTAMPMVSATTGAVPMGAVTDDDTEARRQEYREARLRSLLVIRGLINRETGGLVAAPTTSLPEVLGGQRNWDHRFCWLRDVAQAVEVSITHGHEREASQLRNWLLRAIANDPTRLHNVYGLAGENDDFERLVKIPGYEGSTPVRRGSGVATQLQGDAMGQLMITLEKLRRLGYSEDHLSWPLQQALLGSAVEHVGEEDQGIWEMHGDTRVYTHSQIMLWAALQAGIRGVRTHGLAGDAERWEAARDRLADQIWTHGFNRELNSFVQYYGGTTVDSALLNIGHTGFVPFDSPELRGTADRIERELDAGGGLIYRYRNSGGLDGFEGQDNPHFASSLWLAEQRFRSGDAERGRAVLDAVLDRANDVGLFSAEYSVRRGRMTGNFPQTLAHIALVSAVDVALEDMGSQ